MGAIEDLGLGHQPLARAVPDAPPVERPVSEHIIDELIDEEKAIWGDQEERRRASEIIAPDIERMLLPAVGTVQMARKVAKAISDYMVDQGIEVKNEHSLRGTIVKLSQRANVMDLGNLHPALKAYAYVQAVKQGGAAV